MKNFNHKMALFLLLPLLITMELTAQKPKEPGFQKKKLPDIEVVKIYRDRGGKIRALVRNRGLARIPDKCYDPATAIGLKIKSVDLLGLSGGNQSSYVLIIKDPDKKLQEPGGEMTWLLLTYIPKGYSYKVSLEIDGLNILTESDESNNYLAENFYNPAMPDLRLAIVQPLTFKTKCRMNIKIQNIGTAGVDNKYYNSDTPVLIKMYRGGTQPWGSMTIKEFDPAGSLKKPKSECWQIWCPTNPSLLLRPGSQNIKVVVDEANVLTEIDETNNSITYPVNCIPIIPRKVKKN